MDHLHFEVTLRSSGSVRVELDQQSNVRVMSDSEYRSYCRGGSHRYHGGFYTRSPAIIPIPSGGRWHVAVDLGDRSGRVSARVSAF